MKIQTFFVHKLPNKFYALHQNIQGILSKTEIIDVTLAELQFCPDVLCFSETFIKNGEEKNINITNYELAAHYSRNKKRGGTCILTKKGLAYKKICTFEHLAENFHFECCSISIPSHKIIIVCVYRSSAATKKRHIDIFLDKLECLLNVYLQKYGKHKIVIIGDFNVNTLKDNNYTRHYTDILENYNMKQHISEATRKASCLDHIISNIKEAEGLLLSLYLSDHDKAQLLCFDVKLKPTLPKTIFAIKKCYSSENIKKFVNYLESLYFLDLQNETNANMAFNKFYDWICLLYGLCFPNIKAKINTKPHLSWISKGIKKSCATNRYLRYKYYSKGNHDNKYKYHKYSKILKKCIFAAKKFTNTKFVLKSKNICKASWKVIQKELHGSSYANNYINKIEMNGHVIEDPLEIATLFNNYFINLTFNLNDNSDIDCKKYIMTLNNSIYLTPVSDDYVQKLILTLNNTNSEGFDGICTKVIKECKEQLSKILAILINKSLQTGTFPDRLKRSVVKPLFKKKGEMTDPNNYRPITLIPILSKIFEKVMHNKLVSFFDKFDILCRNQYGFQKNKSTTLATFDLVNNILKSINNNDYVTVLFFDMSKAFDFVSHNRLIIKLESYGIRGNALSWIRTYLQNRMQLVEISQINNKNNTIETYQSEFKNISTGVPQGSILGPLLFLAYINDLPKCIKHKTILFADDISVIVTTEKNKGIRDHDLEVNKTLGIVIDWLNANNLKININKTYYMNFNNFGLNLNIHYQGQVLKHANSVRFLGTEIDSNLDWKQNVDNVCSKINRFSFALYKLTKVANKATALTAYFAYVESVLRYGLVIWGNSTNSHRAFVAQKKCVRAICGVAPDKSCRPLFKLLNILPLPCLYIFEVAKFVKKNPNQFKQAKDLYTRNTRNGNRLVFDFIPKSARMHKNCFCMCVIIYNKIPQFIKDQSFNQFKKILHEWLVMRGFYSVQEFLNYKD